MENPAHCDFIKLRTMLITHMQDLQDDPGRRRVQLVKERQDLQKIVEFVQTYKQELKRKHAAYGAWARGARARPC